MYKQKLTGLPEEIKNEEDYRSMKAHKGSNKLTYTSRKVRDKDCPVLHFTINGRMSKYFSLREFQLKLFIDRYITRFFMNRDLRLCVLKRKRNFLAL